MRTGFLFKPKGSYLPNMGPKGKFISTPSITNLWSDPTTWGGAVPIATDVVTIAAGHTVYLDTTSAVCASLDIQGTLIVPVTSSTGLATGYINVRSGGVMQTISGDALTYEKNYTQTFPPSYTFTLGGIKPRMGINIGALGDYETVRIFADSMKSARAWCDTANTVQLTGSQLDANGWPNQDCSIYMWAGISNMQGYYALSFTGQATITPVGSSSVVVGQSYNSTTNTTTATITYANTGGTGLFIVFTNTKKTSGSATNTGFANYKLMRPTTLGGTSSFPATQLFSDQFISALGYFTTLRTMDYLAINGNMCANWADRTTPSHASQVVGNPAATWTPGYEGRGGALEYAVMLANQTNKDLWINVPVNATDDYITKMAQLAKYGSDGVNPYTSVQASPVYPPLNSGLHLYVEYANELWNYSGAFTQTPQNAALAASEVALGGSPINFDGETNTGVWAWRRIAKRSVDISNLFRGVWGDAAMNTTIRVVLMSQLYYALGPSLQQAILMFNYYANPARVATPRLPSYYFYGAGGSAYYGPSDKTTVDQIFATMNSGWPAYLQADLDLSLALGLKRIAYEGGPSLDKTGVTASDAAQLASWSDSRMATAITTEQTVWDQNGGDLLMYFTLSANTDYYQWAMMTDVITPSSPKMTGIAVVSASTRATSTYGTAIPATIAGSAQTIPPNWIAGGGTNMVQSSWNGYPVLVASARTFTIALTSAASSSGIADIVVDGVSIGTVSMPSSGTTSAFTTPTLSPGTHGVTIRCVSGTFSLSTVVIA